MKIGVTATSTGVPDALRPRLNYAVDVLHRRGYEVELGQCLDGTDRLAAHVSAPASQRAAELMAMLTDPAIRAVVPPYGGETAIDVLPLLDWEAIAAADPTWVVGYSDIATLVTPLTLRGGMATIHGSNLMDTPYRPGQGLLSWLDIAELPAGGSFAQVPPGRYRRHSHVDFATQPQAEEFDLDAEGGWIRIDAHEPGPGAGPGAEADAVKVSGRLIGGCIETVSPLAGSPLADVPRFAAEHAPEGTIVYVEAAEANAFTICRALHGMRLAGFFTGAAAVLVGRTNAPDDATLTQHEAVLDALGSLGIPIIADVDCGHVAPFMPLVNGALAEVTLGGGVTEITQTLA